MWTAVIILIAVTGIIFWRRAGGSLPKLKFPKWELPKFGGGEKAPTPQRTGETSLARKMVGGILGFIIFHALFSVFFERTWDAWFANTKFFLFTNLGIIGFVLFPTLFGNEKNKKEIDMGRSWALIYLTMFFVFLGTLGFKKASTGSNPTPPPTTPTGRATKYSVAPYLVKELQGPDLDSVMVRFPQDTVMWNIAACESGARQFEDDARTTPLLGRVDSADIGVFQINRRYHGKTAQSLGIDLRTLSGNMDFAEKLYRDDGVGHWSASEYCWREWYQERPATFAGVDSVTFLVAPGLEPKDSTTLAKDSTGWWSPRFTLNRRTMVIWDWAKLSGAQNFIVRAQRDCSVTGDLSCEEIVQEFVVDTRYRFQPQNTLPWWPKWVEFRSTVPQDIPIILKWSRID